MKTKKTAQTYTAGKFLWIFIIFFIGVALSGWFIYRKFVKAEYIKYKEFGIYLPKGNYLHGIDVSKYQEKINWESVDSMEIEGISIDFAFIKATEGIGLKDKKFSKNWKNIQNTTIKRGAYHFFRVNYNPTLQANFFLSTVNFQKGDLLPVLDVETTQGKSSEQIRQRVKEFLDVIEKKLGVKAIIYTNVDFYINHLNDGTFEEYPLWIAHYNEPNSPRIKRKWHFWQHSDCGNINSIKSKVDFNVFDNATFDLEDLLLE